jgi:hypothetical protein
LTRYFLDTTAHIERWAGDRSRQERVRGALTDDGHVTSTHALREWKHIIEGATADVLNALAGGAGSLPEVFAALSQGWGRSTGQRLRVLSMLAAGEDPLDAEVVQIRAQALLRYKSLALFHHQINEVRDSSQCGLARNRVFVRRNRRELLNPQTGRLRCKKTDTICRQDHALGDCVTALRAASQALLKSSDAGHRKMGKVGQTAAAKSPERKGKNCYGSLGDISIALEVQNDEVVLTTDRSFEVMAPALGIAVERFNPTFPP